MFKAAVYIGRFQPPHAAHVGSVLLALKQAKRVLVLLGSANLARSTRQPFTPAERQWLFCRALGAAGADLSRITFLPLPDYFSAPLWAKSVEQAVASVFGPAIRPALVGLEKDTSSAYLRWFPEWPRLSVPPTAGLNATDIRTALFTDLPLEAVAGVPTVNIAPLRRFAACPTAARLRREWQALQQLGPGLTLHEHRSLYIKGEFIYLERRQQAIGQGLWALPEVLAPPDAQPAATFEAPSRSVRGPVITDLWQGAFPSAPQISCSLKIALSHPRAFFDDHSVIIQRLLSTQQLDRPHNV